MLNQENGRCWLAERRGPWGQDPPGAIHTIKKGNAGRSINDPGDRCPAPRARRPGALVPVPGAWCPAPGARCPVPGGWRLATRIHLLSCRVGTRKLEL